MPRDYDYREIDDVIHGRVRLAVMAFLSGAGEAEFNEIKSRIGGTDGNLSVHLKKLEDAGYVRAEKRSGAGKPRTMLRLTRKGEQAFLDYIASIEALLRK
jgi:DNA-binding transcriptional ArsR family regulator